MKKHINKLMIAVLVLATAFGVVPAISTSVETVSAATWGDRYQIVTCDEKGGPNTTINYPRQDTTYSSDGNINTAHSEPGREMQDTTHYYNNNTSFGAIQMQDLHLEGSGCFTFKCGYKEVVNANAVYGEFAVDFYAPSGALTNGPINDYKYISFDLFSTYDIGDNSIVSLEMAGFTNAPTNTGDNGHDRTSGTFGYLYKTNANSENRQRGLELGAGWKHIVLPIGDVVTDGTNLTKESVFSTKAIQSMRFLLKYHTGDSSTNGFENVFFAIDDVCLLTEAGLEDNQQRNDMKDYIYWWNIRKRGGSYLHYIPEVLDTNGRGQYDDLMARIKKIYELPDDYRDIVIARTGMDSETENSFDYGYWAKLCYDWYQSKHNPTFHSMDAAADNLVVSNGSKVDNAAATLLNDSPGCLVGTGSQKITVNTIANGGDFHFTVKGNAINLDNLTGQLYLIFDMYIADATKLKTFQDDLSHFGEMRIMLDNQTNVSGEVTAGAAYATREQAILAYSKLKQGWNQVAIPLTRSSKYTVQTIRFFFEDNADVMSGMVFALDDMRICDQTFMDDKEGYTDYANAKLLVDYLYPIADDQIDDVILQGAGYSCYEAYLQIHPVYRKFYSNYETASQKIVNRRKQYNDSANDDRYSMEFCHINPMEYFYDTYDNQLHSNVTKEIYSQGRRGVNLGSGSHIFYGNRFEDGGNTARGYQRTTDITPWIYKPDAEGTFYVAVDVYIKEGSTLRSFALSLGSSTAYSATTNPGNVTFVRTMVFNQDQCETLSPGWHTFVALNYKSVFDNQVDLTKIWAVKVEFEIDGGADIVVDDVRVLQALTYSPVVSADYNHETMIQTLGKMRQVKNENSQYDVVSYKDAEDAYSKLSKFQLMQLTNRGDIITWRSKMQYAQVEVSFGDFKYDLGEARWDVNTHTYTLDPQTTDGNKISLNNTTGSMQVYADITAPKQITHSNWGTLNTKFTNGDRNATQVGETEGNNWKINQKLEVNTIYSYYLWLDGDLYRHNIPNTGETANGGNITVTISQTP